MRLLESRTDERARVSSSKVQYILEKRYCAVRVKQYSAESERRSSAYGDRNELVVLTHMRRVLARSITILLTKNVEESASL